MKKKWQDILKRFHECDSTKRIFNNVLVLATQELTDVEKQCVFDDIFEHIETISVLRVTYIIRQLDDVTQEILQDALELELYEIACNIRDFQEKMKMNI